MKNKSSKISGVTYLHVENEITLGSGPKHLQLLAPLLSFIVSNRGLLNEIHHVLFPTYQSVDELLPGNIKVHPKRVKFIVGMLGNVHKYLSLK